MESLAPLELLRQHAACDFVFPFVEQWPVDGAGSKVGHVLVPVQAGDGRIELSVVLSERRAVTRQQPFHIAVSNSSQ